MMYIVKNVVPIYIVNMWLGTTFLTIYIILYTIILYAMFSA
jgi:hypothetical protein